MLYWNKDSEIWGEMMIFIFDIFIHFYTPVDEFNDPDGDSSGDGMDKSDTIRSRVNEE